MFLFSLSNIEVHTMGRTRPRCIALMKLRPARALVRREGREIEVAGGGRASARPGIVKPGEAIRRRHRHARDVARGPVEPDRRVRAGREGPRRAGLRRHASTSTARLGTSRRARLELRALARIVRRSCRGAEQKSRTEGSRRAGRALPTIVVIVAAVLMLLVTLFVMKMPWSGPTGALYRTMTLPWSRRPARS